MQRYAGSSLNYLQMPYTKFLSSFIVFTHFTAQNPTSDKWLPLHNALILRLAFLVLPLCCFVCHPWQVLPEQYSWASGWWGNAHGNSSSHRQHLPAPLPWLCPTRPAELPAVCARDRATCHLKGWERPKKAETAMQPPDHNLKIPVKASCTGSWCHCWGWSQGVFMWSWHSLTNLSSRCGN